MRRKTKVKRLRQPKKIHTGNSARQASLIAAKFGEDILQFLVRDQEEESISFPKLKKLYKHVAMLFQYEYNGREQSHGLLILKASHSIDGNQTSVMIRMYF